MSERYKIKSKSVITGNTREGTGTFTEAQADMIVDTLNKQDKGLIVHWKEQDNRNDSQSTDVEVE